MQIAEEALVPAAEAEKRNGRGHAIIHAQHASLDYTDEFPRARSACGEDAGAVAVFNRVHRLDRFIQCFRTKLDQNRAKNLFAKDAHLRLDMINQRRPEEETALAGQLCAILSN